MEKKKKRGEEEAIDIDWFKTKTKKRWKARQIKNGNSWATPKKTPSNVSLSFCQRRLFAVGFTLSRPLKDIWLCAQLIVECTFRLPKLNGSTSNWDVATKIHFYPPFKTFKPFFFFSSLPPTQSWQFRTDMCAPLLLFRTWLRIKTFPFSFCLYRLIAWLAHTQSVGTHTHTLKTIHFLRIGKDFCFVFVSFFLGVSTREEVGAQFFVLLTKSQ